MTPPLSNVEEKADAHTHLDPGVVLQVVFQRLQHLAIIYEDFGDDTKMSAEQQERMCKKISYLRFENHHLRLKLQETDALLKAKDEAIKAKQEALKAKDELIAQLKAELSAKNQLLAQKNEELANIKAEIEQIKKGKAASHKGRMD